MKSSLAPPRPAANDLQPSYRHVYLHVPFCARRCAYCDFAIAVRRRVPVDDYVGALRTELDRRRFAAGPKREIDTLYLGGGTPSRLGGTGVARVLALLRERFHLVPGAEVTLEANPEDVDRAAVAAWRDAGVNRVSLGVQSFDASVLDWMHRTHSPEAIVAAADALAREGMTDWSLDLIYALPPEVPRRWEDDVERAIALAPTHLSAYGLTVEEGTPLARWRSRGTVRTPDDERHEEEFLFAHRRLADAGFEHYEVSNWARPGARARHNSAYWRGVPYLGLGPGAHGFDGTERRWNEREYVRWRERLLAGDDPCAGRETLTEAQQALEALYVGLRTVDGVALEANDLPVVQRWCDAGWGTADGGRLRLTPLGWLRLDALVAALTEHRSRY